MYDQTYINCLKMKEIGLHPFRGNRVPTYTRCEVIFRSSGQAVSQGSPGLSRARRPPGARLRGVHGPIVAGGVPSPGSMGCGCAALHAWSLGHLQGCPQPALGPSSESPGLRSPRGRRRGRGCGPAVPHGSPESSWAQSPVVSRPSGCSPGMWLCLHVGGGGGDTGNRGTECPSPVIPAAHMEAWTVRSSPASSVCPVTPLLFNCLPLSVNACLQVVLPYYFLNKE